jgi:hypothetical protein
LQAEITSLLSQVPGSVGYAVALAKIALEFKSDIESKGLTLETLVSASALASDLICSVVPNLEKESGSSEPAVEKPPAVKQAAAKAETEEASKVWQNPDIEKKTKENEEKVVAHTVTSTPPTKDTGALTVVPAADVKEISTPSGAIVKTVPPGSGNNTSPDAGFQHKKSTITEKVKFEDIINTGGGNIIIPTKYSPVEVLRIMMHPPATYDNLITSTAEEKSALAAGGPTGRWRGGPRYKNRDGPHMEEVVTSHADVDRKLPPVKLTIDPDVGIGLTPPFKTVGDHPGNIVSVTSERWNGKVWAQRPGSFRGPHGGLKSDKARNKRYGGFAAVVRYVYLENYDADISP